MWPSTMYLDQGEDLSWWRRSNPRSHPPGSQWLAHLGKADWPERLLNTPEDKPERNAELVTAKYDRGTKTIRLTLTIIIIVTTTLVILILIINIIIRTHQQIDPHHASKLETHQLGSLFGHDCLVAPVSRSWTSQWPNLINRMTTPSSERDFYVNIKKRGWIFFRDEYFSWFQGSFSHNHVMM